MGQKLVAAAKSLGLRGTTRLPLPDCGGVPLYGRRTEPWIGTGRDKSPVAMRIAPGASARPAASA